MMSNKEFVKNRNHLIGTALALQVELVQAVFDKHGPAGEQWGVALKLKEPFPVKKGGTVMTGHIAISLGSEAEMQGWVERLAHWPMLERLRTEKAGTRKKGGLRRDEASLLVVAPNVWSSGLESSDKLGGGPSSRHVALRK